VKILCFAPHSAIWIHAFPEALVAEAAMQRGHEIFYVGCGGLLNSHCVAMSGCGVSFEATAAAKERVCVLCKNNANILREEFGLSGVNLVDVVSQDDVAFADALVASTTPENFSDVKLDGIEIGRIALYELLIQNKKNDLVFSAIEWQRYRASLKNVVMVLRGAKWIFADVKPDRVVLYNALYSVNRVVCSLSERLGVPQYFVHAGENLSNRLNTIVLSRGHAFSYYGYLRMKWPQVQHHPCDARSMRLATDHFIEVIKGRSLWAYSSAPKRVDLRRFFSVADGQ
jgi:hypothetical protein